MTISRPKDYLVLSIPTKGEGGKPAETFRPWEITMPKATAAITLRARIIAALGVRTDHFALATLRGDEEVDKVIAREGSASVWEDKARRLLRNARAGRAIRGLAKGALAPVFVAGGRKDAPPARVREPVVGMREAAEALHVVATAAGLLGDGALTDDRAAALFGRVERGELVEAGLLWELAFACRLTYWGEGADLVDSEWSAVQGAFDRHGGGALEWARSMDGLMYPDEAHVLWAWCLIHTFRPF